MKLILWLLIFLCKFLIQTLDIPSYQYNQNGAEWTEACQTGTQQSPIDIITKDVIKCDDSFRVGIAFNNSIITSENENLYVTFKAYGNWSTLTLEKNGNIYNFDAVQFHFHAPSEHTVNNDSYDGEIHIVHILRQDKNQTINLTRNFAVLGIFMKVNNTSEENPFFEEYDPTSTQAEFELNINEVLGQHIIASANFFFYDGGLTTPPCGEVVYWFVMANPIQVSQSLMSKFQSFWAKNSSFANGKGNNRMVMPLNGREVKAGTLNNWSKKYLLGELLMIAFLLYF